jgi:hypothetical protein
LLVGRYSCVMEPQLFSLEPERKVRNVSVFHDERGFTARSRYGLHGMLSVPDAMVDSFGAELRRIRHVHGYRHEIHFKKLGGARPTQSPDWKVARDWLRFLFEHGLEQARFKAFAVDFHHEEFDRSRYPKPLDAYRRFAVTNGKSLIAWSLRGDGLLYVTPFTDAGNPHARFARRRDGTLFDSFGTYVERECLRARVDEGKAFYPEVQFRTKLTPIPSSPSKLTETLADSLGMTFAELSFRSDLIQLTDLLVGSLGASLSLDATNYGKQMLVEQVATFLSEAYSLPLAKALKRSRRLSLSCFPGPGRTPYAVSLSGVRRYGVELLRTTHDLKQLHLSTVGFRADAVPEITSLPMT